MTDNTAGKIGTCFLFDLGKSSAIEVMIDEDLIIDAEIFLKIMTTKLNLTVQVRQDGHDAWFVEFAQVEYLVSKPCKN